MLLTVAGQDPRKHGPRRCRAPTVGLFLSPRVNLAYHFYLLSNTTAALGYSDMGCMGPRYPRGRKLFFRAFDESQIVAYIERNRVF